MHVNAGKTVILLLCAAAMAFAGCSSTDPADAYESGKKGRYISNGSHLYVVSHDKASPEKHTVCKIDNSHAIANTIDLTIEELSVGDEEFIPRIINMEVSKADGLYISTDMSPNIFQYSLDGELLQEFSPINVNDPFISYFPVGESLCTLQKDQLVIYDTHTGKQSSKARLAKKIRLECVGVFYQRWLARQFARAG